MNGPEDNGTVRGELIVHEDQHGQRLDSVLAEATGLSRNRIQSLIEQGWIKGPLQKPGARVKAGQHFLWQIPPAVPMKLEPQDIPLDILYEDEHLIVINKPAGMVVHPSHGHAEGTLVHALLHHVPELPGINGIERPGIVHRLDRFTSGSLVVAKSERAHQALSTMFAHHELRREYLAWCRGEPRWHERSISLPIARHPVHRKKMAVVDGGRRARTDVRLESQQGPFCRLRLILHTGRTHQIRVHLSHIGLPLLGDPLYARHYRPPASVPQAVREAVMALPGQALHAEVLGFRHPITGVPLLFKAPWPDHLLQLDAALQKSFTCT
ncbi:MAG: RluA family pseudouridine synthase [Zetaproteobacteria bacterium]|nr:MAG: RluA family pseudouridine synthase [Zetaproteobacteria bacterium]